MPKQKNIHERIMILDELLQDRKGYSTEDLWTECEARLKRNCKAKESGKDFCISINTIRNDLDWIEQTYGKVVEHLSQGKNKKHRYADRNFSIYKNYVAPENLPQMRQMLNYLMRFQGQPMYEWVQDLPEKLHIDEELLESDESIVGFDSMPYLVGSEWFGKLFNYVINKQAIKLTYQDFDQPVTITVVHPYYLKQFNRRWYVFAWNEERGVFNYALDRIKNVALADVLFVPNDGKFDSEAFFEDIVGVTRLEKPVEKVGLRVYKESWNYVITKPLHGSQTHHADPDGNGGVVTLHVIPNYELEQTILYFGEYMEVLEPLWLRERIAQRVENMKKHYDVGKN